MYNCIGMFHAKTLQTHKERVSESLVESNGTCRVVFVSTALGMGVNMRDVRQVVHYGPPRQMEDFVQEISRAGRDGKPAKSILLYTGLHLKKCEQTVKDYAKTETVCLRKIMLSKFAAKESGTLDHHDCCCICHKTCNCSGQGCKVLIPSFAEAPNDTAFRSHKERKVKTYQTAELEELLVDYKVELEKKCSSYVLSSEATTGFSSTLIKSVLRTSKNIFFT